VERTTGLEPATVDYRESGWEIDHVVAHGENQNEMSFVFKLVSDVPV